MKTTIIGLLLLATASVNAQEKAQTYQLADAPRYSEETGYGYDLVATPEKGSKAPFFFSVRVPDGNYQVTVRLGSKKQAGVTTVRGESRRLFIDNLATKKGQFVDETFIINKRNPRISEKESVRIKPREKAKLNWDDKLTLEFNGDAPVCQSISIEPASFFRYGRLYRQLCGIGRISQYVYCRRTFEKSIEPDKERRLSFHGIRA